MRDCKSLILFFLLTLPLAATAERAFIIDQVKAGLHADKNAASPILKLLPTGSEVEVLARDGERVQVRTRDDQVGWLDADYLMPAKPTRQLLNETRAELQKTQARLQQLQAARRDTPAAELAGDIETLRATRERLETELAAERAEVAELRKQLSEQQTAGTRVPAVGNSVWLSPHYVFAGLAVLLLIGMLIGSWLMDVRQRRRHGGFRV